MTGRHRGFTLIETMIVIAIVAIVLSLAIPSYLDYTIRTRVSEGLMLAGPTKLAVTEVRALSGRWPGEGAPPEDASIIGDMPLANTYVREIRFDNAYRSITIEYANHPLLGEAAGKLLILTPTWRNRSVIWTCNGSDGFGVRGDLPTRYLPANCR